MPLILYLISYFLYLVMATGCQVQGKESADPNIKDITRRDLFRAARSSGRILIVDAWQSIQYKDSLRDLVSKFHHPDWQLSVKDAAEVTREDLALNPSMLVGSALVNPWIQETFNKPPFILGRHEINIGTRHFDSRDHALVVSYFPNPLNVKMPISAITSEEESLVWELVQHRISGLINGNWNYEVIRGRISLNKILVGNLAQNPENRWELDLKQQMELPGAILNQWESGPFIFRSYHNGFDQASMADLDSKLLVNLDRIQKLAGRDFTDGPIHYYLYPSTELKGLMTGDTDQSHADYNRLEVHTALDDHFTERYFSKENQLIIRKLLGKPSFDALETGLSVYFSDNWQQEGYQYWAGLLVNGGNALSVEQILTGENYSRLKLEALSGSLVEFLLINLGKKDFLEKYKYWVPEPQELTQINRDWWLWIRSQDQKGGADREGPADLKYLQGFNFTHEGYQIYNGYGSRLSAGSLDRIGKIGSNAVAIVPYGWMRDPKSPAPFRFSNRPGSENDEGIMHAISNARERQLFTLLKPHIWVSGSWPGEIEMSSDQDWELFFEFYYQWISHYALLAEMYNVDALCIGVELTRATLNQEARWRNLIHKIRRIYSGRLTYAANWGEEFESIDFWDQLDFIGLNCYYPLSDKKNAKQEDLKQGFAKVLQKVSTVKARFNRPVVFTEIGFRSVESPWLQPHAEAGVRAFNEEHQATSYEVVLSSMSEIPVVDGILWWKWPTNLEYRDESDRRFVPSDKKAELVIQQWFSNGKNSLEQ